MTLTGIVLAGGRSTRMGQDKATLLFDGETMVERAIRIVGSLTNDVVVVARPEHATWLAAGNRRSAGPPVRIVHDPVENLGPLAGIAAGLAASRSDVNLIVACDMPLVKAAVLQRLIELRDDADICVAVVAGRANPLCAVYRAAVGGVAQALLARGERRVMVLLDQVQTKRVDAAVFRDLDPNLDTFTSCNSPEELATAALKYRRPGR